MADSYTYGAHDNSDDTLKTLDDGKPPETRIGDGSQAYSIWSNLWEADNIRSQRRTRVKGLVDGNPPFDPADLAAVGQSYRCNVNWGNAKAYLDNASGAFYDLFNEAPTYSTVQINKGTPSEQTQYSRTMTEHFDWLLRYERRFDYNIQVSQNDMTLYGLGPLAFNDELDWCPRAIATGLLKVPEMTKSDTNYWELATVEVDYNSDELWRKIIDEKSAKAAGWNVSAVKQAIMNASPVFDQGGLYRTWEWHQQQLKNGSYNYSQTSKMICVVQIFFQEFTKDGNKAGKISQVIINRDQAAQKEGPVFLYQKLNRYDSWDNCIHPMYFDRGGGGFHHSVTGQGVKMFPALTFINRLRCANADKAFAPKIAFRPTTATSTDEFSLEVYSDYMVMNEGYEAVQLPTGSYLDDGIGFDRFIGGELQSNLSQYRQQNPQQGGNPKTATEIEYNASNEARLAKTQMVRYYMQMDALYSEMYRRAVYQGKNKVGFGWERCKEFVDRCVKDGTPLECLDHVEFVKATRVTGQGSEFMRQKSLEFLWTTVYPGLPEGGKFSLIQDIVASHAGQSAVERYAQVEENPLQDNQYAWAVSQTADMKTGVPAVVTDSQNPAVFSGVFVDAATQSIQSLEQGGNPAEVVAFLELCGQAIGQQINRMAMDKSRAPMVKALTAKLKEIGQVHDKLAQQLQEEQQFQQEEQMRLQQAQQDQQSDQALKWRKMESDAALKKQKSEFQMQTKAATTRQSMALTDTKTAQEVANTQAMQNVKLRGERMKAAAKGKAKE